MEPISTSIERDVFLAAISVIPAAIVWIALNHFYLGATLGVAIFLAAEYGYPAIRSGKIDISPVLATLANLRGMIRSRVARRA